MLLWSALLAAGIHPALSGVIVGLLTPVAEARRAEHGLHPWVAFGIMPLFALANAGVNLGALNFHDDMSISLVAGIAAGLVIGKPLGIVAMTAITVRLRWCSLPDGLDLKGIGVIGCLAGIGFTMSIFISQLAFPGDVWLATAKVAVLIGSAVAAILGLLAGSRLLTAARYPTSP